MSRDPLPAAQSGRKPVVFIAYTRRNLRKVNRIVRELARRFDVEWDQDPVPGEWRETLRTMIEEADHFILVLSKQSSESDEVWKEWNIAGDAGAHRIVLTIDAIKPVDVLEGVREEVRATQWYPEARLLTLVDAILKRDSQTAMKARQAAGATYKPELLDPLEQSHQSTIRLCGGMVAVTAMLGVTTALVGIALLSGTAETTVSMVVGGFLFLTSLLPGSVILNRKQRLGRLTTARAAYERSCGQGDEGPPCSEAQEMIKLVVRNEMEFRA